MLPVSRLGDLKFLTNVDDASLKVLIKASLQYIDSGVRDESTAPDDAKCVDVLAYLFAEAARLRCSETDFRDSLVSTPLKDSTKDVLCAAYLASLDRIRLRLSDASSNVPHFVDLDWRMDVQVASRSLRRELSPTWIFKLTTTDGSGGEQHQIVQTDAVNLRHLYEELSVALAEEKTVYARRIMRNIV